MTAQNDSGSIAATNDSSSRWNVQERKVDACHNL